MFKYEESEVLKNVKLNITKRRARKETILLFDTQRRLDDYLAKIKFRANGEYEDIPHFIITKTGDVIQLFDTNYTSKTFNFQPYDRTLIKIALENLGWLTKNTITGVLHNWIGDPYRGEPFVKKWRDYYFWDPYTEEQLKSLVPLCQDICKEHDIPYQTVPGQGLLTEVRKFSGIVCKSNFLTIYTHINPSFNFNIFYKDEYKKAEK